QPQPFSYVDQILTHPACTQRTPADLGLDFTGQVNAALSPPGGAPYVIQPEDRNTVNGWPFPCNFGPGGLGWVGVLAAGAAGSDRLTGIDIDGYAVFGEVVIGLTDRLDLTLGTRYHDQESDQYAFDVAAGIAAGITAPPPPGTNQEWSRGGVYDGIRIPGGDHVQFDADTYRAALRWTLSEDLMFYVGYTEGFN